MQNDMFATHQFAGLSLRNRLVRSATWEGMADAEGCVTSELKQLYGDLAAGGVGLIISGFTNILPEGNAFPGAMGLFREEQLDGVKRLAERVQADGCVLCLQLGHGGGQCSSRACGGQPVAPSALSLKQYPEQPRELSVSEIDQIVAAFAAASARAKRAGCNALQLHAAHGYLINQFLSPLTNRRSDQYGGDLAGRSRFLLEVYAAVREAVGPDFPVLVKLNGSDNLEGGLSLEDACEVAIRLDAAGVAAIEVSGGTPASGEFGPVRRGSASGDELAYNAHLSQLLRQQVNCPVIVVGGIRSLAVMNELLRAGHADYISLSRPLVREPELPKKLKERSSEKATCTSCNGCFKAALKGQLRCVLS